MATITPRNGKFLARVRLIGKGSVSKTFNEKRAATAWAHETEDAIRRGIFQFDRQDVPTLSKALIWYEKHITPSKRGANRERYVLSVLRTLPIINKPLDQITAREIAALRDDWLKDVSPSTIQKRLALLSHLYNVHIKERHLDIANPLLKVSKPVISNRRTRTVCIGEMDDILAAATQVELPSIAWLAWHSAARLGELVALEWQDVNISASTMTFQLTKNGTARTVPLVPEAVNLLKTLQAKTATPSTGPIFNVTSQQMSKAWALAVKKARKAYEADCARIGAEPDPDWLTDVKFHDLRHSAVTRLAEHGLSTLELAAISGHKTLSMLGRYTHIKAETLATKLARLEGVAA